MKKLLLFISFLFSFGMASAQHQFILDFLNPTIVDPKSADPKSTDTVYYGEQITIEVSVYNAGTKDGSNIDFPGGKVNMQYYVGKDADVRTPELSNQVSIGPIKYGYYSTFIDTITITKHFFKPDMSSIIIIWPSGEKVIGLKDSLDSTKYIPLLVYVSSKHYSGVKNLSPNNAFNVYPNPVTDAIHIQMAEAAKGSLVITDMTGKVMLEKDFETPAGQTLNLPLNDGKILPNGIYFLGIQSGNYREVRKIFVNR